MDSNVTPTANASVDVKASVADNKSGSIAPTDGKTSIDTKVADKIKTDSSAEKEVIRKIKLGDVEYDEPTLQQMIEKSKGADKKFLEAAKARKEAMRVFKMAKENPEEFLRKTGGDPEKWAYEKVAKDIQDKLRDPKELELEKVQKELEEYRKKETEAKNRTEQETLEKQSKALEQRFHAEIIEAMEAFPELPKNGFTVAQLARAIDTIRSKTGFLLTAKEVAPQVVQDIRNTVKGVISKATPEQLEAMLGEDTMKALRAYDIARLKNPLKDGVSVSANEGEKPKSSKWKNSRDFWKTIDQAAKAERGE